jgi:D-aminopeptidase
VGVLVQTNHGGVFQINGIPVDRKPGESPMMSALDGDKNMNSFSEGSCMVVVATDAPLDSRNLKRLAKRALLGIARTGGYYSGSSGDYAIAFSTAKDVRIPYRASGPTQTVTLLRNEQMSQLFLAAAEATEEAILNSLFKATTMKGKDGRTAQALPLEKIKGLIK